MAEALVVARIPEEISVAPMGNDVIDVCCGDDSPGLLAHHAQRVRSEIGLTVPPPSRVVPTLGCRAASLVDGALSCSTMAHAPTTTNNQHATIRARCGRPTWH